MFSSTSTFPLTFTRQVRPAAAALVLVLSLVLAGCLGGADDDGGMLDDGNTDDGTHDVTGGDGNATDDDTLDESQPFEPETHTWDGVIPTSTCVYSNAGTHCVTKGADPPPEVHDSNTFEVSEGATLASFEFTWDDSVELFVNVTGDPTVEGSRHSGTSPLQLEVPMDDDGTLAVSVYTADYFRFQVTGIAWIETRQDEIAFHMELTVS